MLRVCVWVLLLGQVACVKNSAVKTANAVRAVEPVWGANTNWKTDFAEGDHTHWAASWSSSWSASVSEPVEESKCKKGLCVPVQPWLKNRDTGAVNDVTLEDMCRDIRDCGTCAESPNCDWDPTTDHTDCDTKGAKGAVLHGRKCSQWEGGFPYPTTDFLEESPEWFATRVEQGAVEETEATSILSRISAAISKALKRA